MRHMRAVVLSAVLALTALVLPVAPAVAGQPGRPLTGSVDEHRIGKLIGKWWVHYLALPSSVNPLVGNGSRCDRIGKVIMPVYGPGFPARCTVPAGTRTFLNLWTAECSTVEPAPYYGKDKSALRTCAEQAITGAEPDVITVVVDGVAVPDLKAWHGTSSLLTLSLPPDNLLGSKESSGHAVASGWALLLRPLSPGSHQISFCMQGSHLGPFAGCSEISLHVTA